jgi:hypothetical protein
MTLAIRHAERKEKKLRIALAGPPGSGKTFTALTMATVLAEGGKILVIDTQNSQSEAYADEFDFEIIDLETFHPNAYIEALGLAFKEAKASVVIIDSLSHAWSGEGGILDIVRGNFNNWKTASPIHAKLINTILRAPYHVISLIRSKREYSVETINGSTKIKELGAGIVQRDDVDYEFDLFGYMNRDHELEIKKSVLRHVVPVNACYAEPGAPLAESLLSWSKGGKSSPPQLEVRHAQSNGQNTGQSASSNTAATPPSAPAQPRTKPETNAATQVAPGGKSDGTASTGDQSTTPATSATVQTPYARAAKAAQAIGLVEMQLKAIHSAYLKKNMDISPEAAWGTIADMLSDPHLGSANWGACNNVAAKITPYRTREHLTEEQLFTDLHDEMKRGEILNAMREMAA